MELSAKTVDGPVLKTRNGGIGPKSITTIVLGNHDFLLMTLNFGNLASFSAILAIFSLSMRRNGYL